MRDKQRLRRLCGSGYEESVRAAILHLDSFPLTSQQFPSSVYTDSGTGLLGLIQWLCLK
jgi:hypothetical protein